MTSEFHQNVVHPFFETHHVRHSGHECCRNMRGLLDICHMQPNTIYIWESQTNLSFPQIRRNVERIVYVAQRFGRVRAIQWQKVCRPLKLKKNG